ncbi:non-hydrolyzing UDP-N-acetylglucosamine 2-epimerase [Promethearchaeum syntrophicum]|uniref:Non-hydrolyzing UDP-N-acetylglucosamine 2-epimerase n=1 Tax=Promethearchaeum syntrophicum TaxID=2594042 RepID=A0A5B9DBK7_9ARCH|nr:UDP-N-acetylglucosamine 2-epimerase (non-hydrolyzing) [Candidatus Prometheoarchaeum syntrophicum]QEE16046.1 UDP-N-acetylglucosamine 2-epimerase [Candidatus Prometheoarchaeum syntrophicum]
MKKIKIAVIIGTRPELIKLSVIVRLLQNDKDFHLIYIHSGQHYDDQMFKVFLNDLELPAPDYNVNVGSYPNSVQTGKMLIELYEIIKKENPDIILAQGDTNTVLCAALTAFKNNLPFGHVEAGIRSFDRRMPEEINRILTGSCASLNFAPTKLAVENLLNDGILPNRIFLVGNPIVDVVNENIHIAKKKSNIDVLLNLKKQEKFILLTMHRPSNVDNVENLRKMIISFLNIKEVKFIFPAHPRTLKKLKECELYDEISKSPNLSIIEPLNYFDMLKLLNLSSFILTDSGGLQEEAVILKKPCITLRDNTERPESIEVNANILVGNDIEKIKTSILKLWNDKDFYNSMIPESNPFGDGNSSKKIIQIIKKAYNNQELSLPYIKFDKIIPYCKLIDINDIEISVGDFEKRYHCIVLEIFDKTGNLLFPTNSMKLEKKMRLKVRYF